VTIKDRVANFIVETRWKTLPEPVRDQARRCLVDDLGATLAGSMTRVSQIASEYAAEVWRGDEATILLHGRRAGAVGAAFANAWTANALDIDDGLRYAYGHAGAQVFPAALAVAEARGLSGARMVAAMVVGYEVAHRVGRCWHDSRDVYQACGSWGSVASAAAAANLMELTSDQAWEALGIAEYHAPNVPMMRDIDDPTMVKHGIGWGAMTGVVSAGLASRGFTGVPSILGAERYRAWVDDVGETYIMVGGVAWKQKGYACCSWAHAAAKGARRLIEDREVALENIATIRVEGFHEMVRLGAELPTTTEEAQFNVAWPVAAMVVDGEIGPAQMLEDRLDDPALRAVARKVELVESEALNELCRLYEQGDPRGRFASRVTVVLQDGTSLESGLVDEGSRFPNPPWEQERLEEKFRWLTGHVLDEARREQVLQMAWRFEAVPDVRDLTDLVRA
jgi:2-methylcitrate dehydratase PrpD